MQPQHRGVNIRRWRERRGRQGKEILNLSIHLRRGREQTIIANTRRSGDAVGHLALHHQNGTGDQSRAACGKELQQNVRSDVVRKVPNDISRLAFGHNRSKVGLQNIVFDNLYLGLIAKSEGQFGRKSTIEFQRNQPATAPGQDFRDGPVAGSDLDHGSLAEIAKSVDDGMTGSIVHKKVLAEFWLTFHLHPMVCD